MYSTVQHRVHFRANDPLTSHGLFLASTTPSHHRHKNRLHHLFAMIRVLFISLLLRCVAVSSFTVPKNSFQDVAVRPQPLQSFLIEAHLTSSKESLSLSTTSLSESSSDDDDPIPQRLPLLSIAVAVTTAAIVLTIPTHGFHDILALAADYPNLCNVDASGALAASSFDTAHAILTDSAIADTIPSLTLSASSATATAALDWSAIFQKAFKKAVGGGKAGASAAVVQVLSLMWLRTAMNYQYRYGGDLPAALKTLWSQGGIPRLYQGLPFALVQGPLTRFGDTAANVGILALLGSLEFTQAWPIPLQTAFGSAAAGLWRVVLLPIDSSKTAMQVEGADGLKQLWSKVLANGDLRPLYQGAVASAAATAVGHFPWFLTYNALNEALPVVDNGDTLLSLLRSAFLGLCASCVSDTCSNSLRVIKTTKQTAQLLEDYGGNTTVAKELSWQEYQKVISIIVEKDGLQGLFGRGLKTRLLTNAIQGSLFSVLWKYFQQTGGPSS